MEGVPVISLPPSMIILSDLYSIGFFSSHTYSLNILSENSSLEGKEYLNDLKKTSETTHQFVFPLPNYKKKGLNRFPWEKESAKKDLVPWMLVCGKS